MATPLSEMLPQIVTLNVPDQPFSYYAQGNQIIGWWDIAKIAEIFPTQVDRVDQTYRLTVTLNAGTGAFGYNETRSSVTWATGYTDEGFRAHGKARSTGKRIKKEFSFTFGRPEKDPSTAEDTGPAGAQVPYRFQEEKIKGPLFEWLQRHGWVHQNVIGEFFAP